MAGKGVMDAGELMGEFALVRIDMGGLTYVFGFWDNAKCNVWFCFPFSKVFRRSFGFNESKRWLFTISSKNIVTK